MRRAPPSLLALGPIALLHTACGPSEPSGDDTDAPAEARDFYGLTCTPPSTWDPTDPAPAEVWDFMFVRVISPILVPPDGDLMEQCVSRAPEGGWETCNLAFERRGFDKESFRHAILTVHGEPLTPSEAVLVDVLQRCLRPEPPVEPDADIEIEPYGWLHRQYGISEIACPDTAAGRWGGGETGVMAVSIDFSDPTCEDDVLAEGWTLQPSPDGQRQVAWIPDLTLELAFTGRWSDLEAAR